MLVASPLQSSAMPVGDIPSFVFDAARQRWDDVALVDAATEQRFTISEICVTSTRLAAGLTQRGLGGRVISVFDNTDLGCVFVYYAALMAGGAYQALSTETAPDKLRARIEHSQTPAVFTTAQHVSRLLDATAGLDVAVFVFGPEPGASGLAANLRPLSALLVDDPTFVPVRITSKGAAMATPAYLAYAPGMQESLRPLVLSHFGLLSACRIGRPLPADSRRTAVSAVPFANSHGIANIAHFPILSGSCVVQLRECSAAACLAALEKWRAEVFLATYSALAAIVAGARRTRDGALVLGSRTFNVGQLQVIFMHELRGSRAFKDRVAALFDARLVELYGYMETGLIAGIITEHPRVSGSVGLLCPDVRSRVELDGKELGDGEYGELLVTTPRLAAAHGSDPAYFRTGDFGTVTRNGVVIVRARMAELLRLRDARVVAPADIEEQLLCLPYIADCAAVADRAESAARGYDTPLVFIVPVGGIHDANELLEPLVALYPGIAGRFVDKIPRTDKGDPDRPALLQLLSNG
ncbi:hypothetical protein IWW51_001310 [Coemansia sp. RSA 2702]|nr:hypothetical protein IWW51_001310 [Coemansia sp. RSA 2702]